MIWRFCWGMGLMDVKVIIGHLSLRSTFRNMISLTVVLFDCESESDQCFLKFRAVSFIFVTQLSYLTMESPPGKHQSLNWQHFERLESGKAKCRTCRKEISCTGGNTSGLLRHLEALHPKLAQVRIYLILDLLLHSLRSWTPRSGKELFRDRRGNLNQEKEVQVRGPGRTFLVHKSTRWTKNCRRSSMKP